MGQGADRGRAGGLGAGDVDVGLHLSQPRARQVLGLVDGRLGLALGLGDARLLRVGSMQHDGVADEIRADARRERLLTAGEAAGYGLIEGRVEAA